MNFWEILAYGLTPAMFILSAIIGTFAYIGTIILFDWVSENCEWWRLKAQMKRDKKVRKL